MKINWKKRAKDLLIKFGYNSKPHFLVIGAQKAGTTGLFQILNRHTFISGSKVKEVHYFDNDEWFSEGRLSSYHAFFPLPHTLNRKTKLFEATPIYLFHPQIAQRLYEYNPKLKLIIMLRNPSTRAFSAWTMYHHHFRTGNNIELHDPRSFTDAVAEEIRNMDQTSFFDNKIGYVKRGIYHYQIEDYLKFFPASQLHFVESAKLKKDPQQELAAIQSFLNVPQEHLPLVQANKSMVAEIDDYKEDIEKLRNFYSPYNKKLYKLIGKEFNWDDEKSAMDD